MSVTNSETFKLYNGACKENGDEIVKELARLGIASSNSSGVITIVKGDLDGADGRTLFGQVIRLAEAAGATFKYTVAS